MRHWARFDGFIYRDGRMKNSTISRIGWSVFGLLLGGQIFLSQPYSGWAGRCFVIWLAGCVAYSLAIGSNKPVAGLLKDAAITCLIIGGLCFMLHGSETRDEYGGIISEGFETTFDGRAGAAVKVFAGLFIGALAGIVTADNCKQQRAE